MKLLLRVLFALIIVAGLFYFFWEKSKDSNSVISDAIISEKVDMSTSNVSTSEETTINYELIPRDELYDSRDSLAKVTLEVLKEKYKLQFETFIKNLRDANALPVFCWLTQEIGNAETTMQRVGKKYIKELCATNNVLFIDLTTNFFSHKAEEITFMPIDGHLNEKGAEIVAQDLSKVIRKYNNSKSTTSYSERPLMLGDFGPNQQIIKDKEGAGLQYLFKTNNQGLRIDYELKFPKKKQRILLIGDSGFFFPFLDNDKTGTAKLQAIFPDKEIVNAANWGYSIDDYVTLWNERAKYIEPDIVLLQSTGDDIADQFFSHRLKYSRNKENIKPTDTEKAYYKHYSDMQMGK